MVCSGSNVYVQILVRNTCGCRCECGVSVGVSVGVVWCVVGGVRALVGLYMKRMHSKNAHAAKKNPDLPQRSMDSNLNSGWWLGIFLSLSLVGSFCLVVYIDDWVKSHFKHHIASV